MPAINPIRLRLAQMARNPHPQRRRQQRLQRPAPVVGTTGGATTGRRVSFFVFACTIPFATIVLIWQHSQLMERLEGGGEYYSVLYSDDESGTELSSWGDSVQQAVDVVKFVAYGSGLLSKNDDEEEDYDDDDEVEDEIDDESNSEKSNSGEQFAATEQAGSIIPFDLSVNHLQLITDTAGKPPTPPLPPHASSASISEDFLPVVKPSEVIFRWRHTPKVGSLTKDAARVTAYRIVAHRSGGGALLWDSDKVEVGDELPYSSPWPATIVLKPGEIVDWRVILWDAADEAHSSSMSKFAVGPGEEESDWKGRWIAHPFDMDTFKTEGKIQTSDCDKWKMRRSLPLFRARLSSKAILPIIKNEEDPIASALLVVSGLGSFRVSMDGVPLSTSGPIDPPFTDYSSRVMYRGFDVTDFLVGSSLSHVVGITMGSGWWDHRPISGMAKPELLPRGPATVIAQLYLTTSKGKVHIVIPTEGSETTKSTWQVTRGHIRESDLFTGEIVDVGVMSAIEGWDTPNGKAKDETERWIQPVAYRTDVTVEERKQQIALKAKAMEWADRKTFPRRQYFAAPIGKLVPSEIPPVMAMERIAPDEIHDLGSGRWLFDFGKAISGMLHFDDGLPSPIIPETYPRAHGFKAASERGDSFITVIYGESLEMTTGDINRVLVAGLGLHDGGPRHVSNSRGEQDNIPCFPEDHDGILSQRDVFMFPKRSSGAGDVNVDRVLTRVRQSHFTTHGFRFAEICCTAEPPADVHALMYRTAFPEWGTFDSSNVLINGGYELVKNAMNSNMLSVQSDCPHREKLPYGGDLVADSPAAMHMFDMSSFYKKTVRDWIDGQWDNGAYTETSVWQNLNDYAGIGHGA
ncbi:hypothetical protein ACHAXR_003968, partial [Thalassiosira sp. AJA248-18]